MGTQNSRFSAIGDINERETLRCSFQNTLDDSKSIDSRKRMGQFATPYKLACEIVSYALTLLNDNNINFLEPSIGTGSFYSALLSKCDNIRIKEVTAFELDKDYYDAAKALWIDSGIQLINEDFTKVKPITNNVNLLISNPPYVRHHFIDKEDKERLINEVFNETGYKLSGLTSLYCYFMLLAKKWLAPNAIGVFLVPSEFMDVNYGKEIKEFLLNDVTLKRIHRFNPNKVQFDDALVSSCIVIYENKVTLEDYNVDFTYGQCLQNSEVSKNIKRSILLKDNKWTHYPLKESSVKENSAVLGDFFDIKRGLVTGDNNYFILSKNQIKDFGLSLSSFIPILPSPKELGVDLVEKDNDNFPLLDKQLFLLNCREPIDEIKIKNPILWEYLKKGIPTTSEKYICRHRKLWYLQEKRQPSLFLCSYMGKPTKSRSNPFRFILNKSDAVATNSYLNLYPKQFLLDKLNKSASLTISVWRILNELNSDDLENEGRVYGGGLHKIEPKELAKVPCRALQILINEY